MKHLKSTIFSLILGIVAVLGISFAFTPTPELQTKLDGAVTIIERLIDQKGESFRTVVVDVLENYHDQHSSNERVSFMIGYLIDALDDHGHSHDETDTTTVSSSSSSLPSSDYLDSYTIDDTSYGTQTTVVVTTTSRTITTNALPNHDTGDFPNNGNPNTISAQDVRYELPVAGTYVGDETWAHIPGVGINGVKLEPETAEVVECDSGESYKIEAFQDYANLGLDDQNAHVQPTGEYHYHGHPHGLSDQIDGDDLVHIGFAQDGFLIYYSKEGTYTPSYQLIDDTRTGTSCSYRNNSVSVNGTSPDGTYVSDREYIQGVGDLDACNGTFINDEYVYLVTDEYPYIGRCLNGEYNNTTGPGSGGPAGGPSGQGEFPPPRR